MAPFIFIKTIVDMLYALSVLDYALMAVATIFFIFALKKMKKFHIEDFLAFSFMALLCITFFRTGTGFTHFVKMLSGFMLYFIGRSYFYKKADTEKSLIAANYIVVLTNLLFFVLGIGFIIWGNANTFRGVYFYKTDFGIAMIYAISAFLFFGNPPKSIAIIEWIIISYLILRSNTRAVMLITVLVFGLWLLYLHEKKNKKTVKINFKYVIATIIVIFLAIYLITRILNLPIFEQYHFLNFDFNSLADILNTTNTQGRNVIWNHILASYKNASWIQKAIGIDFVSDSWNGFESHNAYLKILFSTGYIGLAIFMAFIVAYICRLNKLKDRSLFYYNLSILLTFIIQSITQSSIDFTQMTWVFFCFAGIAVSESYYSDSIAYHFNEQQRLSIKIRRYRF